jgi:ABC-type multidrug transport system fused ATPase/permease subunit
MKFARILLIAILVLAFMSTALIAADVKSKDTKATKQEDVLSGMPTVKNFREKKVYVERKAQKVADLSTQALVILDELHQGVKTTIGELRQGAKVAVPEVVGAVARAIFWRNLAMLIRDFVWAVLIIWAIVYYFKRLHPAFWKWCGTQAEECTDGEMAYGLPVIAIIVMGIVFMTFFCNTHLFEAKCWMGVFDQKAYLANMILEKIKLI